MIRTWWLAIRPKTLTAAVVPVIAATALVNFNGAKVDWSVTGLCLLAALLIQVATNFLNDAIDFKKGADTHERIGPVRVTQSGMLSGKAVTLIGVLALVLALLCGIPLVVKGGLPILVIGVFSLVLAYAYTGGPFPLAYLGLGDVFVILFFGLIAVSGVYYLHTGVWSGEAMLLGFQIGCLATVLLAINNLRDVVQDQKANKRTLAVRFGQKFAKSEIMALIVIPFLLQLFWFYQGGLWAGVLPLTMIPIGFGIVQRVRATPPSPEYNMFLAHSARLHSGFGLMISLGLILG